MGRGDAFFENVTRVRLTKEAKKQIKWLLRNFGLKYDSESHVLRCAVNELYNARRREFEERKKSKEKKRFVDYET